MPLWRSEDWPVRACEWRVLRSPLSYCFQTFVTMAHGLEALHVPTSPCKWPGTAWAQRWVWEHRAKSIYTAEHREACITRPYEHCDYMRQTIRNFGFLYPVSLPLCCKSSVQTQMACVMSVTSRLCSHLVRNSPPSSRCAICILERTSRATLLF